MPLNGFPKREHLCLQRDIDALFSGPDGSATAWPLRCLWRKAEGNEAHTQMLVSVAKRHLHHAVDRNRAKRQIREAYRLQKHILDSSASPLHIAFIWMADTPQPSAKVHAAVERLLAKITIG